MKQLSGSTLAETERKERSEIILSTPGCVIKNIIIVKQLLIRYIHKRTEDNLDPEEFYTGQYSEVLTA